VRQFEKSNVKSCLFSLFTAVMTLFSAFLSVVLHANSGVLWPWVLTLVFGALCGVLLYGLLFFPRILCKATDRGITLCNTSSVEISLRDIKSVTVISIKRSQLAVLNFTHDFRLKRLKVISQKSVALSSGIVRARFTELLRVLREAHSNFHDGADPAS